MALSRGFPRRLPTTLPCGVRTFLEGPVFSPTSPRLPAGSSQILEPDLPCGDRRMASTYPSALKDSAVPQPRQRATPASKRIELWQIGQSGSAPARAAPSV